MAAVIIDRGRGPEIAGTRITVFNILDYLQDGCHHSEIAATFRISSDEVKAAISYIEANKTTVMDDYAQILARSVHKDSDEIAAKGKKSRQKLQDELERIRQRKIAMVLNNRVDLVCDTPAIART